MSEILNKETMDDLNGRFITFYLNDAVYGIELLHVVELINMQAITEVPNLPKYIRGVVNLRGKILPVVDARLKLAMPEREYDDKTCIIVLTIDEIMVGLIVDRISDVVAIEQENIAKHQKLGDSKNTTYLKFVSKVGDRIIYNLDCRRFILNDD